MCVTENQGVFFNGNINELKIFINGLGMVNH